MLTARQEWEEQEAARKRWHYAKCQGVKRRHKAAMKAQERLLRVLAEDNPTTVEHVQRLLSRSARVERELSLALCTLPSGPERRRAIQACLAAGYSKATVARLMCVSRQRITQLCQANDEIPF